MSATPIHISPVQWASLPDISEVARLSADDHACLDAVRQVLVLHNAIGRFGIHLSHKHFEVAEDEVLVEYTNVESRTLECRVEKRFSAEVSEENRIETMWSFNSQDATRVCDQQCVYNSGHANRHYRR
jgi:hypothetical protein